VSQMAHDPVCNPDHYLSAGLSPQALIEAWELQFAEGNVVKYVARAQHKGNPREDLKKAIWYAMRAYEKCCAREDGRTAIDVDDKDNPDNPFGQGFLRDLEAAQERTVPVEGPGSWVPA